jgi:hypothetical protein
MKISGKPEFYHKLALSRPNTALVPIRERISRPSGTIHTQGDEQPGEFADNLIGELQAT